VHDAGDGCAELRDADEHVGSGELFWDGSFDLKDECSIDQGDGRDAVVELYQHVYGESGSSEFVGVHDGAVGERDLGDVVWDAAGGECL
jgi:hypothetical protein